ncbi:MAG TPA: HEAT repeat domain-containing protein [Planctomycetota bacterium]|nr:HEAT repeat domain-containing protein [Planctomycetota bacterium]
MLILRSFPVVPALVALVVGLSPALHPAELSASTGSSVADIAWQNSYEKALEAAKAEHKVIFIAVNMDGEGANDRLAKNVYTDPGVVALSSSTINVIASIAAHSNAGVPCTRFKVGACDIHQVCEKSVRKGVVNADETGSIVAPQHVFLDCTGRALLSVPYEISVQELEWCLATAVRKADPTSKLAMPAGAHMPSRVVIGAVYDPKSGVGGALKPLTKEGIDKLISDVKRGLLDWDKRQTALWGILHSDLPEALDFIRSDLRSGSGDDERKRILRAMGAVSPQVYWEMAAEFISADDDELRQEASAALEQMGAPQSLKAIEKQLAKEKKPEVRKDLIRALAACGARDPKVRATVVKRVRSEKDELVRISSIVGLGLMDQDEDVRACLQETLKSEDDSSRIPAALAMALSRDDNYLAVLDPMLKAKNSPAFADALKRSVEVLRGGPIGRLQVPLWTVCKDTIPRERTLGIWEQ